MSTHPSDSSAYLTSRQKKAQAAKRRKQRQQEHEQKLDRLVGQWMAATTTVLKDEQVTQEQTTP
jgi:hypothetical protein